MNIGGKKVVDATRNLRVEINSEDARLGKNKNPSACAAARAIVRANKPDGAKQARVHLGRVYVEYPDKWVRYTTPEALKTEIVSFDRGTKKQFMVGEYTLYKPSPGHRLDYAKKRAAKRAKTLDRTGERREATTLAARAKLANHVHHHLGVRARGANK